MNCHENAIEEFEFRSDSLRTLETESHRFEKCLHHNINILDKIFKHENKLLVHIDVCHFCL